MGGWVAISGSLGTDHSSAAPTVSGTPLVTIAVNAKRNAIGVQNQSAGALQLVRDDGTGANQTVLILAAAGASNAQGPDWQSQTFKGRLQIYGAAGSQFAAWED